MAGGGNIGDGSNTVVGVNAASNTFTRNNVINIGTGVTRIETLNINAPRDGYGTRRAAPRR